MFPLQSQVRNWLSSIIIENNLESYRKIHDRKNLFRIGFKMMATRSYLRGRLTIRRGRTSFVAVLFSTMFDIDHRLPLTLGRVTRNFSCTLLSDNDNAATWWQAVSGRCLDVANSCSKPFKVSKGNVS